jgi:hypothetical protein
MNKLGPFLDEIFRHRGFSGAGDYFATIFGLKPLPFFNVQVIGLAFSAFVAFATNWIWNPPGAVGLLIFQDIVNAYYGYQANKKLTGEKWSALKFQKTWSIIASDIVSCAMLHVAIKYYPLYAPLATVLFSWLFFYKLRAIFTHFTLLGYQGAMYAKLFVGMLQSLLKSQVGTELVDNLQKTDNDVKDTNPRVDKPSGEVEKV